MFRVTRLLGLFEDMPNNNKRSFVTGYTVRHVPSNVIYYVTTSRDLSVGVHVLTARTKSLQPKGYFYACRDFAITAEQLKFGHSKNLPQRLRTYRTAQPRAEYTVIVETVNPVQLENDAKAYFQNNRVDKSEVFRVSTKQLCAYLRKQGYTPGADNIFRRNV